MLNLWIALLTCAAVIGGVLFVPKIRVGKFALDSYPVAALCGALCLLLFGHLSFSSVLSAFTADTAVNPLKILVLFISMTLLSVYLDEAGFFRYLAAVTLKHAGHSQKKLFFALYVTVSVLTVFTSNDIIILSFTPFICYFAKNAKIDPVPYLAAEFVAANTWSMALIIGNPTNIYLSAALGEDFLSYAGVMWFPTVFSGMTAFLCLYLLFHKKLSEPMAGEAQDVKIENKTALLIGVLHLSLATLALAIGPYVGLEMWKAAGLFVLSLCFFSVLFSVLKKKTAKTLKKTAKRAPLALIPFLLSMFVVVLAVGQEGIPQKLAGLFGGDLPIVTYGVTSFLFANVVNNIPMSVFYSTIVENAPQAAKAAALFATVVGSNLGAFFTPIGALAGIMWRNILSEQGIRFGYADFLRIGATVAVPSLGAALLGLFVVFL